MDITRLRDDFPILRKEKGVYLDSACQSLRPDSVIEAISDYYLNYSSCGGRSVHHLSNAVSLRIDECRESFKGFLNGEDPNGFVFVRNTTEAINTVALGTDFSKGNSVVVTDTEHNSNYVPWLKLKESKGIKVKHSQQNDCGEFDIENFKSLMGKDVKLVSVQHVSNLTGVTVPVKEVAEIAHDNGSTVLIDGSQAISHTPVNLKKIDADFYAFSVHKMLGPSGVGVLYGKEEYLENLHTLVSGGGSVGLVTYDSYTEAPVPDRFEAGLQDYGGIFGTKAAIDYLKKVGVDNIEKYNGKLMGKVVSSIEDVKGISFVGPSDPAKRNSVLSFNIQGLNPHDICMMLDNIDGIMIRSGMHCAHPFLEKRGIKGSARASIHFYNNENDIDRFATCLHKIADTFGKF